MTLTLDYDLNNTRNCSLLLLCNEIWKIIIDFLHVIDSANLRRVCKRLREITLHNKKMRSYMVFSKNVFDLDFNHHLTLSFESIFDRLGFNFNLPDMLHFRYRVFSLFEYFQHDQFLAHLFNCSRSEVSFSFCNLCSLLLLDNASVSFRLSIDHYFKLMFSKNIFSQTTSEIFNVEKNNRFSLNIFYGSKKVYDIIRSGEQRCIKFVTVSNQSDPIILFAEVFVRIFCHHFYLVLLDFFFLPEQTAEGISKRERFFDAFLSTFKGFFETIMQWLYPGSFKDIFST